MQNSLVTTWKEANQEKCGSGGLALNFTLSLHSQVRWRRRPLTMSLPITQAFVAAAVTHANDRPRDAFLSFAGNALSSWACLRVCTVQAQPFRTPNTFNSIIKTLVRSSSFHG